jgi:hypothetical protein
MMPAQCRSKAIVAGKGWPYEIYLDVNSDLKRALNIIDVPHVLIIKNGKIRLPAQWFM